MFYQSSAPTFGYVIQLHFKINFKGLKWNTQACPRTSWSLQWRPKFYMLLCVHVPYQYVILLFHISLEGELRQDLSSLDTQKMNDWLPSLPPPSKIKGIDFYMYIYIQTHTHTHIHIKVFLIYKFAIIITRIRTAECQNKHAENIGLKIITTQHWLQEDLNQSACKTLPNLTV